MTHCWTVRELCKGELQQLIIFIFILLLLHTTKKNIFLITEYQWRSVKPWTSSHPLFVIRTPTVRKSAGRMKAADAVAISGGSIRGTAPLQMECEVFKAYSHKFFICIRLWGRRGGRPAGLQLKASNNNPGLSQTKGRRGKGTWNEKQQKSFVYNIWTKSCEQSQCLVVGAEKICQQWQISRQQSKHNGMWQKLGIL